MYSRTILVMLYSPIYAIKYVSCYYLQIKNTDVVADFNHIMNEDLFLLGSWTKLVSWSSSSVLPNWVTSTGHVTQGLMKISSAQHSEAQHGYG